MQYNGDIMELKKLILQIIKFGFVGIAASVVDVGLLILLNEVIHIDVIVSSAISFSVSVAVNYILSMNFVFKGKGENKAKEFVVFVGLSAGGLLINQAIMWVGTELASIHYLIVKIFAMVLTPVYNFITRKIFLENRQ